MEKLLDLIDESKVIYNLQSTTIESVIYEIVEKCVESGYITEENKTELAEALIRREKSMSTGIGGGIAIPHCSFDFLKTSLTFLAISKKGIDFNAIDKKPVNIFVLLIVPKDKFQDHIKTLALIAKTLGQKEEKKKLITSNNFKDIENALRRS